MRVIFLVCLFLASILNLQTQQQFYLTVSWEKLSKGTYYVGIQKGDSVTPSYDQLSKGFNYLNKNFITFIKVTIDTNTPQSTNYYSDEFKVTQDTQFAIFMAPVTTDINSQIVSKVILLQEAKGLVINVNNWKTGEYLLVLFLDEASIDKPDYTSFTSKANLGINDTYLTALNFNVNINEMQKEFNIPEVNNYPFGQLYSYFYAQKNDPQQVVYYNKVFSVDTTKTLDSFKTNSISVDIQSIQVGKEVQYGVIYGEQKVPSQANLLDNKDADGIPLKIVTLQAFTRIATQQMLDLTSSFFATNYGQGFQLVWFYTEEKSNKTNTTFCRNLKFYKVNQDEKPENLLVIKPVWDTKEIKFFDFIISETPQSNLQPSDFSEVKNTYIYRGVNVSFNNPDISTSKENTLEIYADSFNVTFFKYFYLYYQKNGNTNSSAVQKTLIYKETDNKFLELYRKVIDISKLTQNVTYCIGIDEENQKVPSKDQLCFGYNGNNDHLVYAANIVHTPTYKTLTAYSMFFKENIANHLVFYYIGKNSPYNEIPLKFTLNPEVKFSSKIISFTLFLISTIIMIIC